MPDNRAGEIAELKQSIALFEEQQRSLGIDLSLPLRLQRECLAQLQQAVPSIATQSGDVNAATDQLTVDHDLTGRDKIEHHTTSTQYTVTNSGSRSGRYEDCQNGARRPDAVALVGASAEGKWINLQQII